ncbi:hypothetical protein [Pendulispora albinea]|uniref:Uncharacterized protein n=1 Tax=Pendulispora albinea TaxID=2741071 RepID=A0ABZ2LVE2_9BACT
MDATFCRRMLRRLIGKTFALSAARTESGRKPDRLDAEVCQMLFEGPLSGRK